MMRDAKRACTVAELISELQKMPADAAVVLEGCDCHGIASGSLKLTTKDPNYVFSPVGTATKIVIVERGEP